MKFLSQFILTAFCSFILQIFLPWWVIGISAMIIPIFNKIDNKLNAFIGGFSSISCLWMIYAATIDVQTNSIISSKIAPMFGFSSSILLVILTGLFGGIVGGSCAISGYLIREIYEKEQDKHIW